MWHSKQRDPWWALLEDDVGPLARHYPDGTVEEPTPQELRDWRITKMETRLAGHKYRLAADAGGARHSPAVRRLLERLDRHLDAL